MELSATKRLDIECLVSARAEVSLITNLPDGVDKKQTFQLDSTGQQVKLLQLFPSFHAGTSRRIELAPVGGRIAIHSMSAYTVSGGRWVWERLLAPRAPVWVNVVAEESLA